MTPEEYAESKERVGELMELADEKGLLDEAQQILYDNFLGTEIGSTEIGSDEGYFLSELQEAYPDVKVGQINYPKIRDELERLFNPN